MEPQTPFAQAGRSPLEGLRILFVDASPDERDLFVLRFGRDAAAITSAASADEALAVLEREEIELLVTELRLAGRDGFELVRRMRVFTADTVGIIPAILATTWIGLKGRRMPLPYGLAGVIVKPYADEDLLAAVVDASPAIASLRRLRAGERTGGSELRARRPPRGPGRASASTPLPPR